MNYSDVFSKAWTYVRKHKILWLFGLLAGTGMIGSGQPGLQYSFNRSDIDFHHWNMPNQWGQHMRQFFENIPGWTWAMWTIGAFALISFLIVASLFITTYGRAGAIKGTILADEGNTTGHLKFMDVHQGVRPHYWKLILLQLLIVAANILVVVLFALPIILFTIGTLGFGLICLIPFIILLTPVVIVFNMFLNNIFVAVIDENLQLQAAVTRAWRVTLDNFGHMLAVALLLGLIRFLVMLIALIPLILVATPVILAYSAEAAQWQTTGAVLAIIFGTLWLLGMCLVSAILGAYQIGVETIVFRTLKDARKRSALTLQPLDETPTEPINEEKPASTFDADQPATD